MSAIRTGICTLLIFAVLSFGGVETWSESIIEIGAALLFLWWGYLVAGRRAEEIRWCAVLWPLLGLEVLAVLQLAARLTVYPYLTKLELLRFTSYLLLLFLMGQAFRTPRQWRNFAWFLVLLGFAVAVFGILQDLTFNGKLYWLRVMRFGGQPFGPYVNRNHFAGLMELIIPVGLAMLAVPGVRRQQLPFVALLSALPVGALFLSASRGGIATFSCEVVVLIILLWMRRGEKRHLFTFVIALVLAGGLVAWLGLGQVIARFSQVQNAEVTEGRRMSMSRGALHIFRDHPLIGTGLGTTVSVYPAYETRYDGHVVDHVHNDHFELLAEMGILGGICWVAFVVMLVRLGMKNLSAHQDPIVRAIQMGALVGCIGLLFHGFMDFNLHIPANALLFYLLAGFASSNPVFGPTN
jgi:O-antigen ligase